MTDDEPTDGYQFRWWRQWRERGPDADGGGDRDYAELQVLEGTERLGEARRRHRDDTGGPWVRDGMLDPHVSALRVHRSGRVLTEELAGCVDVDAAQQPRFV